MPSPRKIIWTFLVVVAAIVIGLCTPHSQAHWAKLGAIKRSPLRVHDPSNPCGTVATTMTSMD